MTIYAPFLKRDAYMPDPLELEAAGWTRRLAGDAVWQGKYPGDAVCWRKLPTDATVACCIQVCQATGRVSFLEYMINGHRVAGGLKRFWGWCADKQDFTTALRMVGWEPWPSIPAETC